MRAIKTNMASNLKSMVHHKVVLCLWWAQIDSRAILVTYIDVDSDTVGYSVDWELLLDNIQLSCS